MSDFSTPAEADAARKHFDACGPFCKHTEFCPACVECYGVCAEHRDGGGIRFVRVKKGRR